MGPLYLFHTWTESALKQDNSQKLYPLLDVVLQIVSFDIAFKEPAQQVLAEIKYSG